METAGTTIAELLDEMGGRLPQSKIDNLIPVINRAVKILSKHLYMLDSDLIKGELEIPMAPAQTYSAATISFVSGGEGAADTIVDSAAQFVIEGFTIGMAIYSDCPGNTNTVKIDSVTANAITLRITDKVTVTPAGTAYTITSRSNFGYIPDDFQGMVSEPNISGYRYTLPPVPDREKELTLGALTSGAPQYHKLMGDKIVLYPGTSTAITICGEYYKRPTKLTQMEDYLPFAGLFDDVIQDYVIAILTGGPAAAAGLAGMLYAAVDLIVSKREKKAPVRSTGIDWEGMHE